MIADYHIHTRMCRHAEGEPREYVERAVELGMTEMGFADHLPFLGGWEPRHDLTDDWAMRPDELDDYVALVQDLAREYAQRRAHRPRHRGRLHPRDRWRTRRRSSRSTRSSTSSAPCTSSATASASTIRRWRGGSAAYGIDRIHLESLDLARQAAESGLFDVAGHLDHAGKFGPPEDAEAVAAAASAALRAVAAAGMALEINTGGLRKPIGRAFPAPALLAEASGLGIPLVLGSDAHRPGDVGHGFDHAAGLARAAGYTALRSVASGEQEPLP